jgi:hypothetical protein
MSKTANITQERLKQLLHYDPEKGFFTRLQSRGGQKAGSVAGYKDGDYIKVTVDGVGYRAHRIAYLYIYGWMPIEVDHKNLIKTDNRIDNLRPANGQNPHNRTIQKNNTSGLKGVFYDKDKKLWRACIKINYKTINLGRYKCPAAASFAYQVASDIHFGEFARPF